MKELIIRKGRTWICLKEQKVLCATKATGTVLPTRIDDIAGHTFDSMEAQREREMPHPMEDPPAYHHFQYIHVFLALESALLDVDGNRLSS